MDRSIYRPLKVKGSKGNAQVRYTSPVSGVFWVVQKLESENGPVWQILGVPEEFQGIFSPEMFQPVLWDDLNDVISYLEKHNQTVLNHLSVA